MRLISDMMSFQRSVIVAHHEMICPTGAIFIFCNLLGLGWLKMLWLTFLDRVKDIATD